MLDVSSPSAWHPHILLIASASPDRASSNRVGLLRREFECRAHVNAVTTTLEAEQILTPQQLEHEYPTAVIVLSSAIHSSRLRALIEAYVKDRGGTLVLWPSSSNDAPKKLLTTLVMPHFGLPWSLATRSILRQASINPAMTHFDTTALQSIHPPHDVIGPLENVLTKDAVFTTKEQRHDSTLRTSVAYSKQGQGGLLFIAYNSQHGSAAARTTLATLSALCIRELSPCSPKRVVQSAAHNALSPRQHTQPTSVIEARKRDVSLSESGRTYKKARFKEPIEDSQSETAALLGERKQRLDDREQELIRAAAMINKRQVELDEATVAFEVRQEMFATVQANRQNIDRDVADLAMRKNELDMATRALESGQVALATAQADITRTAQSLQTAQTVSVQLEEKLKQRQIAMNTQQDKIAAAQRDLDKETRLVQKQHADIDTKKSQIKVENSRATNDKCLKQMRERPTTKDSEASPLRAEIKRLVADRKASEKDLKATQDKLEREMLRLDPFMAAITALQTCNKQHVATIKDRDASLRRLEASNEDQARRLQKLHVFTEHVNYGLAVLDDEVMIDNAPRHQSLEQGHLQPHPSLSIQATEYYAVSTSASVHTPACTPGPDQIRMSSVADQSISPAPEAHMMTSGYDADVDMYTK